MERKIINDTDLEQVVGGSIVFNGDHTTCGRNRNDQYTVVDFTKVLAYIHESSSKMSEKQMLSNLVEQGLLIPIEGA